MILFFDIYPLVIFVLSQLIWSKRSLRYRQDEKEESDRVGGQEKTKRKGMKWKEKCVASSEEEKDAASCIYRSHQTAPLHGRRHFILDADGRINEFSSIVNIIAFPLHRYGRSCEIKKFFSLKFPVQNN